MKGKQLIPAVLASVLIGAALGGPATAAVAASAAVATSAALTAVTASPSTQTFYVDGEQVDLEAYVINGHNYVQLRDIGRAVDFGVEYDQSTNRVLVDTSSPYTEEATASTPSGVVTIPQTDEPLRLQEGDQVLCDDGTVYEITDLRLWEEPEPLPIYDQTRFPELELPKAEVRRFQSEYGDNLHIRNLYETRRMEYTIYNAAAGRMASPRSICTWASPRRTLCRCSGPGRRISSPRCSVPRRGPGLRWKPGTCTTTENTFIQSTISEGRNRITSCSDRREANSLPLFCWRTTTCSRRNS